MSRRSVRYRTYPEEQAGWRRRKAVIRSAQVRGSRVRSQSVRLAEGGGVCAYSGKGKMERAVDIANSLVRVGQ